MRILLIAILFSVLPKLQAQIGVSFMAEHGPIDISGFNTVISEQLGEPVISNASAFLKLGGGFDFLIEKLTIGFYLNNFCSSQEKRVDTTYSFQNFRFEINLGYQILQNYKLVLEPYLGWAINNSSYNKTYNNSYSTLGQYWNSPLGYKQFGYNLHSLNAGLRIHFKKFYINKNSEFGFSLRGGVLIPLSNGNIKFLDQKIHPDQKLVQQSFYIGLICSINTTRF